MERRSRSPRARARAEAPPPLVVMVNGLPGALGLETGAACLRRGMVVAEVALTGPRGATDCKVGDEDGEKTQVRLVGSQDPEAQRRAVVDMQAKYGSRLIVVDVTHPTAVNSNAELYAEKQCPFVMGTTGGDRAELVRVTEESGTFAVVAPNMCKQIVAFQATMERMARDFPGAFGGYDMALVESHQSTKADTSGTAKALVSTFNGLGVNEFGVGDIVKIRDPAEQLKAGVPEEALRGHAWHTYTLTSADGSVKFQFQHNVCGRRTYAEGVVDAVEFLAEKVASGSEQRCFNMIDVLSAGKMR